MNIQTYRYASPRSETEGVRIGVARFLPRGVRREDWQKKGYFDLWLPTLAPDPEAIKAYLSGKMKFSAFARHYRSELKGKDCRHVIELLAGMSLFVPLTLGCFCEDESRCHRIVLRECVAAEAEKRRPGFLALRKADPAVELRQFASPVCYADWES